MAFPTLIRAFVAFIFYGIIYYGHEYTNYFFYSWLILILFMFFLPTFFFYCFFKRDRYPEQSFVQAPYETCHEVMTGLSRVQEKLRSKSWEISNHKFLRIIFLFVLLSWYKSTKKSRQKEFRPLCQSAKRFYQNKAFPPTCVGWNANDKRFCKNR